MIQPKEIARIHLSPTPFALTLTSKDGDGASFKFILLAYTGLKDKNGVEIYEGDICKYYFNEHYGIVTGEVIWNQKGAYFGVIHRFESGGSSCSIGISGESYEVIGNIHEYPDLMD